MSLTVEKNSHIKSEQTKIIIVSDNLSEQEKVPSIDSVPYTEHLEKWKQDQGWDLNKSPEIPEKYEEIIRTLKSLVEDPQYDNVPFKALLSESKIKEAILTFPRFARQKILRRLHAIFLNKEPFGLLFNDKNIRKIILCEHPRILVMKDSLIEEKISFFYSKNEFNLFLSTIVRLERCKLKVGKPLMLIPSLICTREFSSEPVFNLKRISQKSPSLLELMREGTLNITSSNYLSKFLKTNDHGVIVSGKSGLGKTRTLMALLSVFGNSKRVALTGNSYEYEIGIRDFQTVSRSEINRAITELNLDYLADSLAASGVKTYVADDCTGAELALAWILHVKHRIPSFVSISGLNAFDSILHGANSSIEILKYSSEKNYFLWNLALCFPLLINLNKKEESPDDILEQIYFKNNILSVNSLNLINNSSKDLHFQ